MNGLSQSVDPGLRRGDDIIALLKGSSAEEHTKTKFNYPKI